MNTQTPVVRFKLSYFALIEKYGKLERPLDLSSLVEGEDYEYTPGGVTAMVYPLLQKMMSASVIQRPKWVSLGPNAPPQYAANGIDFYSVSPDEKDVPLYTNFKEGIWNETHGLGKLVVKPEEYEAYAKYNWSSAELMLRFLNDVDLFFVHDFQQLLTGSLLGPSAPAILRWHIPFRLDEATHELRTLVLKSAEAFDAMIVSTRRDLEGLIHAGYRGRAYQIYPYTEPTRWNLATDSEIQSVRDTYSLSQDDRVLLLIGRMDKIKNQALAIMAVAKLRDEFPNLKLVLVGNGSFTGSGSGGLAHSKSREWRLELLRLVKSLGVEDIVIFTGYAKDDRLRPLYTISDCVLVSSITEGFNLTAIEAWLYKKPVVVSKGAGSSELVIDDVNGYTFTSGNLDEFAEKIGNVLRSSENATKMGANGFDSARQCFVDVAMKKVQGIFEEVIKLYPTKNPQQQSITPP